MKRIHLLSTLAFICALTTQVFGQCTPNASITTPGYHPPQLPEAFAGSEYREVLNVLVIKDTSILFNGTPATVVVDSAKLRNVIGLPPGFSFECYNETQTFFPTEVGCALITGNPTLADTGSYPIDLVIQMFGRAFGAIAINQTDTLRRFVLEIKTGTAAIRSINPESTAVYPNPSSSGTFTLSGADVADVSIFGLDGRPIPFKFEESMITVLDGYKGVILLKMIQGDGTILTRKVIIPD